jgi:hypothetical protein
MGIAGERLDRKRDWRARCTHAAALLVAALAVLAVSWLLATRRETPQLATPRTLGSIDAKALIDDDARAMEASRVVVASDANSHIGVEYSNGSPAIGAFALRLGVALPPPATAEILGEAVRDGMMTVDTRQLGDQALVIWKSGCSPEIVTGVRPGTVHKVVLEPALGSRIVVRTSDGSPVEGYRVELARAAVANEDGQVGGAPDYILRPRARGGNVYSACSDHNGIIHLGWLSQGTYRVKWNVDEMPVSAYKIPVALRVPGPPLEVVVDYLYAAAFRLASDHVVGTCEKHARERQLPSEL